MPLSRPTTALKALFQLGPTQVALNALYRLGLASGHYRRSILPPVPIPGLRLRPLFSLPTRETLREVLDPVSLAGLRAAADEILAGRCRLFGAENHPLQFTPHSPLAHWTAYETGRVDPQPPAGDIKFIWEPARFGWAFTLGRAYILEADERCSAAFWHLFESFQEANPPYLGPNWMSAQEVGLRLLAFIWASQVFAPSAHSSPARLEALAAAVAAHAARIPATLPYARSQNNNHLLTEAAALYSAAQALPDHPQAAGWQAAGRRWLDWCLTHQIDARGEYVQHSANYQRLMLHTALWLRAIDNGIFSPAAREKLNLASHWLLGLLDPTSGGLPNLGANDGALILPLSSCAFDDYRPLAQAAARAFLGSRLPSGPWDELALWLGLPRLAQQPLIPRQPGNRLQTENSWGCLRALNYTSRPSHADQLHVEIWWRGLNLACDAGTYLYNAAPPWDNRLTSTLVHNTVSVDGLEQMTRAGRFLYLDWAPADLQPIENGSDFLLRQSAQTSAYAHLGVNHTRSLTVFKDERWLVQDDLLHTDSQSRLYRLHWLLPDWEWKLEQTSQGARLELNSPHGPLSLRIGSSQPLKRIVLLRAGQLLQGNGLLSPVFGWVSPTYGVKLPALSLALEVETATDLRFTSEFILPEN